MAKKRTVAVVAGGIIVAGLVAAGGGDSDTDAPQPQAAAVEVAASAAPSPVASATATASATPEPSESASAEPEPAAADAVTVVHVVDGDTVYTSDGGKIRLIGYDTPEVGECGFDDAKALVASLVLDEQVELINPPEVDDADKYDRDLRYVVVAGQDLGTAVLEAGLANARYDGLDGYDRHPLQDTYRRISDATEHLCATAATAKQDEKPTETTPDESSEPWNQPGPDLNCSDIGHEVRITGTDYHRLDRDGDGWACESYS